MSGTTIRTIVVSAVLSGAVLLMASGAWAQGNLLPLCSGGSVVDNSSLPKGEAQTVQCPGSVQDVYNHYRAAMQSAGYELVVEATEKNRGGLAGTANNGGRMSVTISADGGSTTAVIDRTNP